MTAIAERSLGTPVTTPEVTMAAALNQALADALTEDETVLVFGEDGGSSTPRSPSQASSAPPSAWR
jgi:hypothetical protein